MKNLVLVAGVIAVSLLTACVSTNETALDITSIDTSKPRTLTISKREKPGFAAVTAGKALFGLFGAGAMISAGNKIIQDNNVSDPAIYISTELIPFLSEKLQIKSIESGNTITKAKKPGEFAKDYPNVELLLDVQTINWSFGYFLDLKTYRVMYSAKLRLIDIETRKIIAEGFCSRVPEKDERSPTKDQLLANSAERLKQELQIAAKSCVKQFKEQISPA